MIRRILDNLGRQARAAELLGLLLEEEFSHLKNLDPQSVAGTEFSIQELLRQLAVERLEIKGLYRAIDPSAKRLRDVLPLLSPQDRALAEEIFGRLDRQEQRCAKQAERNSKLALGLYDQNRAYLEFIQKQITPKKNVYSANGRFNTAASAPAVLRGRF